MSAAQFAGARAGFAFRQGSQGLGYYRDEAAARARQAGSAKAAAARQADSDPPAGAALIVEASVPGDSIVLIS